MNRKQKICLWVGISVIVLMGLFPPWVQTVLNQKTGQMHIDRRWSHGHRLFSDPPDYKRVEGSLATGLPIIDWPRLSVEVGSFVLITVAFIYTFKDKKPKDKQKQ
jgi:hypothetical protein